MKIEDLKQIRIHFILWNSPAVYLLPSLAFESYFGMKSGADCWKIYFAIGRLEIGIKWSEL